MMLILEEKVPIHKPVLKTCYGKTVQDNTRNPRDYSQQQFRINMEVKESCRNIYFCRYEDVVSL